MQVLVCILLLSSFARYSSSEETLGKVVFANILYRHGDRTPLESYPNDPHKDERSWPAPFGQLTELGIRQHVKLGKWLRDRYTHLLAPEYSEDDIYVSSIDADTTWMSAKANLIGMYPHSWKSIPVHSVPELEDNVLAGKKFCKAHSRAWERIRTSPKMKEIDEIYAKTCDYLSKMTDKNISSIAAVGLLYDTLFIQELYNKTLPSWTKSYIQAKRLYPETLKFLAEHIYSFPVLTIGMQRLKAGPLLKEMIQHMDLKSKDTLTPNRKLWVYSAHDYTIANMLNTLGVFEPHCPSYAAALLIELRVNAQNEYVVMMFYKNSTEEPTLLTLPGCVAACPLNLFTTLTAAVIPDDWEQECLSEHGNYILLFLDNIITTGWQLIGILIIQLLFLYALEIYYGRPDINNNDSNHY